MRMKYKEYLLRLCVSGCILVGLKRIILKSTAKYAMDYNKRVKRQAKEYNRKRRYYTACLLPRRHKAFIVTFYYCNNIKQFMA